MSAPVSLCKHEFVSMTGDAGGELIECERCGLDWDEFVADLEAWLEARRLARERWPS